MVSEKCSYTLQQLADLTDSRLVGDPQHLILGVEELSLATTEDASFLSNPRYLSAMQRSQAGVICIAESTSNLPKGKNFLLCADPSLTFQKLIKIFYKEKEIATGFQGIHPTAIIHPSVQIAKDVIILPYAVIDAETIIGEDSVIGSGVYIGPQVKIGKHCYIHAHVVIRERCLLGDNVIIQPGTIIGSCGFGYATNNEGKHTKLEQMGNVIVEDEVEIGANTTIDRARFKSTIIGKGSKIDNLVQIAHGVKVGEGNFFAAQAGIAGSAKTGKYVVLAGQAGVSGHITLGDRVRVAAKAGVSKSLLQAGDYGGVPARPFSEMQRQEIYIRRLIKNFEKDKPNKALRNEK